MEEIGKDVWLLIIMNIETLDDRTMYNISRVNKYFHQICNEDVLWKYRATSEFPNLAKENQHARFETWKSWYQHYRMQKPKLIKIDSVIDHKDFGDEIMITRDSDQRLRKAKVGDIVYVKNLNHLFIISSMGSQSSFFKKIFQMDDHRSGIRLSSMYVKNKKKDEIAYLYLDTKKPMDLYKDVISFVSSLLVNKDIIIEGNQNGNFYYSRTLNCINFIGHIR